MISDVYCSVELAKDGIRQLYDKEVLLNLPREKVKSIILTKGITAERPIIQFSFAIVLLGAGIFSLVKAFVFLGNGGSLKIGYLAAMAILIGLGSWLLYTALQKRYLLLVTIGNDKRKIAFHKKAKISEIKEFINAAKNKHGYDVIIKSTL